MKTLFEIIELAKSNQKPDYEELLYALLALSALHTFDHHFILELPYKPHRQKILELWAEESFNRVKRALDKPPREWLGWDNDPANPEYQKLRRHLLALQKRLTGTGLPMER